MIKMWTNLKFDQDNCSSVSFYILQENILLLYYLQKHWFKFEYASLFCHTWSVFGDDIDAALLLYM